MDKLNFYKSFIGEELGYEYSRESSNLQTLKKVRQINDEMIIGEFDNKYILNLDICSLGGVYLSELYKENEK